MTDSDGVLVNGVADLMLGEEIHAGVDQVELEEFARILTTGGDEFLGTVYTDSERDHCAGRLDRLAAWFAAKEAATKALGTGLRGVGPGEIEVMSEPNGRPRLRLHGRAGNRARSLGITSVSVSVTHTQRSAVAFVVALATPMNTNKSTVSLRKENRP